MQFFPAALQNLADQFARLPGIGGKTAQRLAFHVLSLPLEDAEEFAGAILEAKKSVHTCLAMSFGATVLIIIFMLLLGRPLYGMFTDDSHVLELGMEILQQLAPFWLCYVCIEIYSGALRGAGDSFLPTLFTLVGVCLLRVAWLLFIVPGSGSLRLTLYCYPITWSITSVMFLVYYYRSSWLKRSMKKYRHDQALPEE